MKHEHAMTLEELQASDHPTDEALLAWVLAEIMGSENDEANETITRQLDSAVNSSLGS